MTDSFDPDLDATLGGDDAMKATVVNRDGSVDADVYVKVESGDEYAFPIECWAWSGEPQVRADDGSLVSPREAAAQLERRLTRLPPVLTMDQHREMAAELDALVEELDDLATELREHMGGQALMYRAMDAATAVSELERELSDNACRHHPTETNLYRMRGIARPSRCRCGLTPDCLRPIPEVDE